MEDSTQQQTDRTAAVMLGLVAIVVMGLIIWTTSYYLARYECEKAFGGSYIMGQCR